MTVGEADLVGEIRSADGGGTPPYKSYLAISFARPTARLSPGTKRAPDTKAPTTGRFNADAGRPAGMLEDERKTVAATAPVLGDLTPGRTGNLSFRCEDRFAITPSGVPYDDIAPGDVPVVSMEGERVRGEMAPSSETPMHRHVYERFDAGAIAHVHSPWATTLATMHEPVRPVHYMLAVAGGEVPVAEYATYGTEALAENAVDAMERAGTTACLLANHGLVATGEDLEEAMETAATVESVARLDYQARVLGGAEPLSDDELDLVAHKFESYGQGDAEDGG